MFERILVPLDGTPHAERALPVAVAIARASQGTLVLVQVVGPSHEYGGALAQTPRVQDQVLEATLAEASSSLALLAHSPECEGVAVISEVLPGEPAERILAAVESHHSDLIVMAGHDQTGFTRWPLGSVTHKVVHHSRVPVFVLREKGIRSVSQGEASRPLRALVPLDGSPLGGAALLPAAHLVAALAAPGPGALHLIQVVRPHFPTAHLGASGGLEAMLKQAGAYLETVAALLRETLRGSGVSITWSVAIDPDVASAVLGTAEDGEQGEGVAGFWGCDFIAMASAGRGCLQRLVMGSVAERVLGASRLPVLLVRPPHPPEMLETLA